jgi:hypothetical protein
MKRKSMNAWCRMAVAAVVVAGVALTSQLVGQSAASASTVPRPVIKSDLTQFDSKQVPKTAKAKCPAGTRVIGGGGRVNGGQHVVITQQEPVQGSPDTFVVSAVEDQFGTAQSWAVEAFAICSVPLPGLEIVTATGAAGSSAFQVVTARCPGSKFALGAGGRINNGSGQVTLNTQGQAGGQFPLDASASGLEDLDGFSGIWSETAFAICANANTFGDIQLASVQSVRDTTARKIVSVFCPAGKRVTGGAAFAELPGVVESVSPDANRVQVIARQDGTVTAADRWAVIAFAFCAS